MLEKLRQYFEPTKDVRKRDILREFVNQGMFNPGIEETAKAVPRDMARFLISAKEAPNALRTGQASGKFYDTPLGRINSFQSEAANRVDRGDPMWKAMGNPMMDTILAGSDLAGFAALTKGMRPGMNTIEQFTRPKGPKGGTVMYEGETIPKDIFNTFRRGAPRPERAPTFHKSDSYHMPSAELPSKADFGPMQEMRGGQMEAVDNSVFGPDLSTADIPFLRGSSPFTPRIDEYGPSLNSLPEKNPWHWDPVNPANFPPKRISPRSPENMLGDVQPSFGEPERAFSEAIGLGSTSPHKLVKPTDQMPDFLQKPKVNFNKVENPKEAMRSMFDGGINPGKFEQGDAVFVNTGTGAMEKQNVEEIARAVAAKSNIITDVPTADMGPVNDAQKMINDFLSQNGYQEIQPGMWSVSEDTFNAMPQVPQAQIPDFNLSYPIGANAKKKRGNSFEPFDRMFVEPAISHTGSMPGPAYMNPNPDLRPPKIKPQFTEDMMDGQQLQEFFRNRGKQNLR